MIWLQLRKGERVTGKTLFKEVNGFDISERKVEDLLKGWRGNGMATDSECYSHVLVVKVLESSTCSKTHKPY